MFRDAGLLKHQAINLLRSAVGACLTPLLLVALPSVVHAQFTFATNNGNIIIYGYTGPGGAITIPNTIGGLPVTEIVGTTFFEKLSLTSVVIQDGIKSIGQYAFYGCAGITNLIIPNSVTNIGDYAFSQCDGLSKVTIPNGITSFGDWMFDSCAQLKKVTISDGATFIGADAFPYCWNLSELMNKTATPNTEASTNSLPLPSEATSDNPPSTINHQPTIALFPKATRDMLNLMLDDGLPYKVIVDELGESAQGLNLTSLAKWVQSGYQEYLQERKTADDVKTEAEFAADLLRGLGDIDPSVIHHASLVVASLQMFYAIREFGDKAVREILLNDPSGYLKILDAICKIIPATIDLENHRRARRDHHAKKG